jgi:hypothetical protein
MGEGRVRVNKTMPKTKQLQKEVKGKGAKK